MRRPSKPRSAPAATGRFPATTWEERPPKTAQSAREPSPASRPSEAISTSSIALRMARGELFNPYIAWWDE